MAGSSPSARRADAEGGGGAPLSGFSARLAILPAGMPFLDCALSVELKQLSPRVLQQVAETLVTLWEDHLSGKKKTWPATSPEARGKQLNNSGPGSVFGDFLCSDFPHMVVWICLGIQTPGSCGGRMGNRPPSSSQKRQPRRGKLICQVLGKEAGLSHSRHLRGLPLASVSWV